MMFWSGDHWAFWQAALMWVGMVAFWGFLIWAVYALVSQAGRRPPEGPQERGHEDSARRILDERFARGEIDAEEYRQRREILESGSVRPLTDSGAR